MPGPERPPVHRRDPGRRLTDEDQAVADGVGVEVGGGVVIELADRVVVDEDALGGVERAPQAFLVATGGHPGEPYGRYPPPGERTGPVEGGHP